VHVHDPSLRTWVLENKSEIINYNREKISSYPLKQQKAILTILSPEKKKELWNDKLIHISNLNLPKEEKVYLKWFNEAFKKINYSEGTSKDLENEMFDKLTEGIKTFNWSNKFVYETFFTLGNADLISDDNTAQRVLANDDTLCECMYDWGCGSGSGPSCTDNPDCTTANNNCGIFGGSQCDGSCD